MFTNPVTAKQMIDVRVYDSYDAARVKAAEQMVRAGFGDYVYQTQWVSGSTLWVDPNNNARTRLVVKYSSNDYRVV